MPDNKTVTFDASQWQLVPKAITDVMIEAVASFGKADGSNGYNLQHGKDFADSWADALAAAPTPAAQSAGQEPIRQVKWHEGDGWVDVDRETFAEYADRALHKRFVYAAPVNGGERSIDCPRCAQWASDGRPVGSLNDPGQHHCESPSASLTSPAKVSGDEREAFETWWVSDVPEVNRVYAKRLLVGFGPDYSANTSVADAWKAWQARAALSADGGDTVVLEGLRDKLFDGRSVTRDAQGWYHHPALPHADEDVDFEKLLTALRIESVFLAMEDDSPEASERYGDADQPDCHYWTPRPPDGDDWCLLAVYDTEDGPYALFGRDAYIAGQKRKQERTRQRAEAIAANQARKGE